jgi:hypothetical protein
MPGVGQWRARVANVEARCEPHARLLLEHLRFDSLYPRVIQALEGSAGKVTYRDIVDTVISVHARKHRRAAKPHPEWLGQWNPTIGRLKVK